MGGRGYAPLNVALARGAPSAARALAIDDTLSAAHTSIGGMNILRRRWRDAEDAFRRATLLDPLNADARTPERDVVERLRDQDGMGNPQLPPAHGGAGGARAGGVAGGDVR